MAWDGLSHQYGRSHPKLSRGISSNEVNYAIASGKVTDYQDPKYRNVKFLSAPDAREHLPVQEDWVTKFLQYPNEAPSIA